MGKFTFEQTGVDGLFVVVPTIFEDSRGYFMETYNECDFQAAGLNTVFVQDNQSKSQRGVLRGMHFQLNNPQGKLVRVISGEVFDVAVDLRKSSPTYLKWFGTVLSVRNHKMLYVPEGFAHGFLVLSDHAEFSYKCSRFYDPSDEGRFLWSDSEIGIAWPDPKVDLILSEKDRKAPLLKDIEDFLPF